MHAKNSLNEEYHVEKKPITECMHSIFLKKKLYFKSGLDVSLVFALHNKHLSYFKPNKLFENIKAIHHLLSRLIKFTS